MGTIDTSPADHTQSDCTTTNSFDDHEIEDGIDLITRTYTRLIRRDLPPFRPTQEYFEWIEVAFLRTYLDLDPTGRIPNDVATAIDDAKEVTYGEFIDRPDADLRTEVLPTFYQQMAGFHCKYRE